MSRSPADVLDDALRCVGVDVDCGALMEVWPDEDANLPKKTRQVYYAAFDEATGQSK